MPSIVTGKTEERSEAQVLAAAQDAQARLAQSDAAVRAARPKAAPPIENVEVDESEMTEDDIQLRALFEGGAQPPAEPKPEAPVTPSPAPVAAAPPPAPEAAPQPPEAQPPAAPKAAKPATRLDELIDAQLTGKDDAARRFLETYREDLRELRKERLFKKVEALRSGDELMSRDDDADVLEEYTNLYQKIGDSASIELAFAVVRNRKITPEAIKKFKESAHSAPPAPSGQASQAAVATPTPPAAGGRPASPAIAPSGAVRPPSEITRQERDRLRMSKGGLLEQDIREIWGK